MTMRARKPAAPAPPPGHRRVAAGLVLVGALVYANALSGPFIIDDQTAIVSNDNIRHVLPLSETLRPPRDTPVAGRPLVNLSFALNYAVGGLDPRGYRATNLAIHLLAALVLFGVVRRTLELEGIAAPLRARSREVAVVCALIWTIHPLQTEVINYVTQRTSALAGLMYLLTLYCSIRAVARPRGYWTAAAILSCAAGMASKELMATAPLMVALYDRVFVYPSFRDAVQWRRRLYAGLAATWLILAALMLSGPRTTVGFGAGVDAWTYLLNQATVLADYLRLTVLPRALVVDYGVPQPLTLTDVLAPALLIVGLAVATLVALARWPRVGFLGVWFFVTLAPTSSFVPIATEVGAERRMYLPLAAIVVLAVCAAVLVMTARRLSKPIALAACVVVCVALAAATIVRNREYDSDLSLAQTVVERRPHGRAYLTLGGLLVEEGRREEAFEYLHLAKRAEATGASFLLGTEYLVDGDLEAGIRELLEFIQRHSGHPNVIPAREMLGRAYQAQGRLGEAADQFREVLRMAPNHGVAHQQLGDILLGQDRLGEALPHLEFVASRRGGDVDALGKLGTALAASGRIDDAAAVLSRAVAIAPNHPHAHGMLGRVLALQGRLRDAIVHLRHAVDLDPGNETARRDLRDLEAVRSRLGRE